MSSEQKKRHAERSRGISLKEVIQSVYRSTRDASATLGMTFSAKNYTRNNRFHVPFSQLYFSVLGKACQKYLLVSTAKLGCM